MGIILQLLPMFVHHVRQDALLARVEVILNARVAHRDIIGMSQQHAHLAHLGVKLAQEGTTTNVQYATLVIFFNLLVPL